MRKCSVRTLKWIRNIIIMAGIAGGLIIWCRIPGTISNNPLVHVGNSMKGSKIGLLILLVLPLLSLFAGIRQEEIHTDDEAECARLEEGMHRAAVKAQICFAVGESVLVLALMLAAILFS